MIKRIISRYWRKKWVISLVVVIAAVILLIDSAGLMMASYFKSQAKLKPQFGVSFSPDYAEQLGLNWHDAFLATINQLGVKHMRLMSYWDRYEPVANSYNFSDLDWQMQEAAMNHVSVILVVGMRQPRWPECHVPTWANTLSQNDQFSALTRYISQVVERYKNNPAITGWQIENEASNHLFGLCPPLNKAHYVAEYNLVKTLDPGHVIITNASNQIGLPLAGPFGNNEGFSIYRTVNVAVLGPNRYIHYWFMPPLWHGFRAAFANKILKTQPFVDELQAEPWGPMATSHLSLSEQSKSMDPSLLISNIQFALSTGVRSTYLWGVEWWYWRLTKFNDPSLWETARVVFKASN